MDTRQIIRDAIERIAPDVDAARLPDDVDFREEAELDSMDFLSIVTSVHEATGVDIAESDYGEITTITGFASFVDQRR